MALIVCRIDEQLEAVANEDCARELGLHLHKSINLGLEVGYSSDVVIDRLF